MNTEFKPFRIGEPDFPKMSKIREKYEILCGDLSCMTSELTDIQKGKHPSFELIRDFVQTNNPVAFVTRLQVEANDIRIPGINQEKLILSGLVQLPDDLVALILQSHKNIRESVSAVNKTEFIYPLRKLWIDMDGCYGFMIDAEFEQTLENHCSSFTRNEVQNQALTIMNELLTSLNRLHNIGFLNLKHGVTELQKLTPLFDFKNPNRMVALNKVRFSFSAKQPGDSFNLPQFSVKDLFELAEAVNENNEDITSDGVPEMEATER